MLNKRTLLAPLTALALAATALSASAQNMSNSNAMMNGQAPANTIYAGMKTGPDHGMPEGTAGGDGVDYTGAPDLQAAVSLVTAGGPIGSFSITTALTNLAGDKVADAEVAKLTKQYGKARVASFVTVQNFAVNDAVKKVVAAGVKLPKPMLQGAVLAKRVVTLGLVDGTYYEGTQLDHLITHPIHEAVMVDIDRKFGKLADANYHLIADQAHYDLAQALGATSVKLAAYH